jgi:hypothetical protein
LLRTARWVHADVSQPAMSTRVRSSGLVNARNRAMVRAGAGLGGDGREGGLAGVRIPAGIVTPWLQLLDSTPRGAVPVRVLV